MMGRLLKMRMRGRRGCHNLEGTPSQSNGQRSLRCRSWPSILLVPAWGAPPHLVTVHTWMGWFQMGF